MIDRYVVQDGRHLDTFRTSLPHCVEATARTIGSVGTRMTSPLLIIWYGRGM